VSTNQYQQILDESVLLVTLSQYSYFTVLKKWLLKRARRDIRTVAYVHESAVGVTDEMRCFALTQLCKIQALTMGAGDEVNSTLRSLEEKMRTCELEPAVEAKLTLELAEIWCVLDEPYCAELCITSAYDIAEYKGLNDLKERSQALATTCGVTL
jgi:hypothetical protein